jgi:catalase
MQPAAFYPTAAADHPKRYAVAALPLRKRMLIHLSQVDMTLATLVGEGLGLTVPLAEGVQLTMSVPADVDPAEYTSKPASADTGSSAALSMTNPPKVGIKTRQVSILAADGVDASELKVMRNALSAEKAIIAIVAPRVGMLKTSAGEMIRINGSLQTTATVLFDAVYVPGGQASVHRFIHEAFMHCKAIAATSDGVVTSTQNADESVPQKFIDAIGQHRFWSGEKTLV